MLLLSENYYNRTVLSLRLGAPIGHANTPIINPRNLKIEGWYATERGVKERRILPAAEVRDNIQAGLVVDDHDALTDLSDMVRLKEIIEIGYDPIGKVVITEDKRRVGKIQDFAVDDQSLYIKKLYVNPSLLQGIAATKQLVVDRDDIVEITDKKIIIKDNRERVRAGEFSTSPAS